MNYKMGYPAKSNILISKEDCDGHCDGQVPEARITVDSVKRLLSHLFNAIVFV